MSPRLPNSVQDAEAAEVSPGELDSLVQCLRQTPAGGGHS